MSRVVIVHGGQTGVDRGAHLAAVDAGAEIAGYMPRDRRDEDGPIPDDVARHLKRCSIAGSAARTRENVIRARALLVVVRERLLANATRGTALTLRCADGYDVPWFAIDSDDATQIAYASTWLRNIRHGREVTRLMIAGPRRSLWPDGEDTARRCVRALLDAARSR